MKRLIILSLFILLMIGGAGCSSFNNDGEAPPQSNSPQQNSTNLGGVSLGMTAEEIDDLLGSDFTERKVEGVDTFGEGFIIRHYPKGIDLVIGETSRKILQVDVFSSACPTNLGVKVGDSSLETLLKYRDKYPEYVGNQSSNKLAGWFITEPETLLIFSSMENRDRSNENLTKDSKIHAITLGNPKYFD